MWKERACRNASFQGGFQPIPPHGLVFITPCFHQIRENQQFISNQGAPRFTAWTAGMAVNYNQLLVFGCLHALQIASTGVAILKGMSRIVAIASKGVRLPR
ncbi:MAG: hypothetical protein JWQ23_2006 [Herminiimonas sp.]|nr:hypothetical protein [Herminiimonas sp.]